jgi:DUF1365 family protein
MYLDLGELAHVRGELPLGMRFRRVDHFGPTEVPLDRAVRELVHERAGIALSGPIALLTQVSWLGHVFNPISMYFCFESDGQRLAALVAEVESTPWRERHLYVLPGGGRRYRCDKALHVSPFLDMDQEYAWRVRGPATSLVVHIEALARGERRFDATLRMKRRELSRAYLLRMLLLYPFSSLRVVAAIYLHALVLWLKGARYFAHPSKRQRC